MKKYFLLIVLIAGIFFGWESFSAYLANHKYYLDMLANRDNWKIFIAALILGALPLLYAIFSSNFSWKKGLWSLFASIAGFGLVHSRVKAETVSLGRFIMIVNFALLFFLGVYLILGTLSLGSLIERTLIKFRNFGWQELFLTFGIGLCGFLGIVQIFIGLGILYGIVSRLMFIGLGVMIFFERKRLKDFGSLLGKSLSPLKIHLQKRNPWIIVLCILLFLSLVYYLYGFQNSFIPYSTAWDANHEYLYIPKIIAENAGILRRNSVGGTMPGIRHMFLTFIFSLTGATGGRFALSSDTIAVSLNFLSAVFVLIFGVSLIIQLSGLFQHKEENKETNMLPKSKMLGISVGRAIFLLWLTSGMGAFLVMVDNKTDLGVMAFSLLALLGGAIFLHQLIHQKKGEPEIEDKHQKKEIWKYLAIAGIFFGFACLAKVTAFVDIALFVVFFIGLLVSNISALGTGLIVIGCLRLLNILTASFMLSEGNAWRLIGIGVLLLIVGIIVSLLRKKKELSIWKSFIYLLVIGFRFLAPLLLCKAPRTITRQIITSEFSVANVIKGLLANTPSPANKLLADSGDQTELIEQTTIDWGILEEITEAEKDISGQFEQCVAVGNVYSEDELAQDLQEVKGGGLVEDVGRYIGFGWKEFTREQNRVYGFAKLLFPVSERCYGVNHDAKLLCENGTAVDQFDVKALQAIFSRLKNPDGEVAKLLGNAFQAYQENPQGNMRDHIVALRQYYQAHSIKSDAKKLYIPYRYVIPLNIVFNRSLQNHSSYYTDIGFSWILVFMLLIVCLPYALCKRDQQLLAVSITTLVGWALWRVIGGAILWYGTVLISRTAINLFLFITRLRDDDENIVNRYLSSALLIVLGIVLLVQFFLNFIRISAQGANGPFVWYKGSVGKMTNYDNIQIPKTITKFNYNAKAIFDLQFPQYNAIIKYLKDRNNEDGVVVAGTYIQYFLDNQWNLTMDGLLTELWVKISDYDLCKSYWRLKNDHTKYLLIDPNIGSVGMGEGNETLFHRFFAKLDSTQKNIEEDGVLTSLVKFYQAGYLKLFSTNNIGALYAFTLDDAHLKKYFGEKTPNELLLLRAKLIGLRYFPYEADTLFSNLGNIFIQRIMDGEGIGDIASILGLQINEATILQVIPSVLKGDLSEVKNLDSDEQMVLIQYLNIYQSFAQGKNDVAQQFVQNLLMNSVSGSSQVVALELL